MVLASVERKPAPKFCQGLGHTLRHGLFYGHFFCLGGKSEEIHDQGVLGDILGQFGALRWEAGFDVIRGGPQPPVEPGRDLVLENLQLPVLFDGLLRVPVADRGFVSQPGSGVELSWGLANAPLNYEPRAETPAELNLTMAEIGPPPMVLQEEPARRLPNLAQVPIAVVTGEASPFLAFDGHLVAYLKQAGCTVDLLRLHEHGVRGNSHGMMLETNNAEVLNAILTWVRFHVRQRGVPDE